MKNLKLSLPLMGGDCIPLRYSTGKELIDEMVSDEISPPPKMLLIEVTAKDGRRITISVPYSASTQATVEIEDAPAPTPA